MLQRITAVEARPYFKQSMNEISKEACCDCVVCILNYSYYSSLYSIRYPYHDAKPMELANFNRLYFVFAIWRPCLACYSRFFYEKQSES